MKGSLLQYNMKLNCLLFSTSLNSSLIIFIRTHTVNYWNALDRLRVRMNIILFLCKSYFWNTVVCYCCNNNTLHRLRAQWLLRPSPMINWNDTTACLHEIRIRTRARTRILYAVLVLGIDSRFFGCWQFRLTDRKWWELLRPGTLQWGFISRIRHRACFSVNAQLVSLSVRWKQCRIRGDSLLPYVRCHTKTVWYL